MKKGRGGKGGGSGDGGGEDTDSADVSPEEKRAAKKRARLLQKQERREAEGIPLPEKEVEEWREELDAFLRRPKGKEKVKMIEEIIQEEWNIFTGKISAVASENNAFVSDGEMMRLWNRYGLEALEDMIAEHLDKTEGMEWQEGRAIFQAIVKNLEDSAKNEG